MDDALLRTRDPGDDTMNLICRWFGHRRLNDEPRMRLDSRENPCLRCGDRERSPIPIEVKPPPPLTFRPPPFDD